MSQDERANMILRMLEAVEAPEKNIGCDSLLAGIELDRYLHKMMEHGLIRYHSLTQIYETTKFGKEFIKSIKQMKVLLSFVDE